MRSTEQTKSKTLLAKILSQENITVVITRQSCASFDLKNRILTIPEMKDNLPDCLYNLFVGHEVAHALETPQSYMDTPKKYKLSSSLLNIIEDIRIEKIIQTDYPGLRKDFIQGYKELLARNYFEIKGKDVNKLHFLDRLNLRAKCGMSVGVTFSEKEQSFVDMAFAVETWADTIATCLAIKEFLKQQPKEQEPPKEMPLSIPDEEDESQGEEVEPNYDEGGEEGDSNPSPSQPDYSEDDNKENEEKEDGQTSGAGETEDESITDKALEKNKTKLLETNQKSDIQQINIPRADYKKYIIPYTEINSILTTEIYMESEDWFTNKRGSYLDAEINATNVFEMEHRSALFSEYQTNNQPMIQYMVKEFALKQNADMIKRTSIAKTGMINNKKLFSYQFNNDIFLRNNVVREGKSHGMIIFLDWSGSMRPNLFHSLQQLFCLLDFCRKVHIPFEVFAFNQLYVDQEEVSLNANDEAVIKNNFQLLQLFSSKMNTADYTMMQKNLLLLAKYKQPQVPMLVMGGTPLNEAIICAMEMTPDFQKRNHLQIVNTVFITDGDSNPLELGYGGHISPYNDSAIYIEDYYRNTVKSDGKNITQKLLELLRIRTNTNVIGFFLTPWLDKVKEMFPTQTQTAALADFNNNGFLISVNSGYTEYYLINSEKLAVKTNDKPKNMLEAMKMNRRSLQNRVILNRFIDLIARQPT